MIRGERKRLCLRHPLRKIILKYWVSWTQRKASAKGVNLKDLDDEVTGLLHLLGFEVWVKATETFLDPVTSLWPVIKSHCRKDLRKCFLMGN